MNEFRVNVTAPQMFAPVIVIPAEGIRLGITSCNACGAMIALDQTIDFPGMHRAWHWGRNEGMGLS